MGGNLHLKLNTCLRPIANKYYLREDAEDIVKRKLKVPEIAGREVSWTSFCLVSLAHDAGVHIGVCVVAFLVCQNQFTCE